MQSIKKIQLFYRHYKWNSENMNVVNSSQYGVGGTEHKNDKNIDLNNTSPNTSRLFMNLEIKIKLNL